MNTILALELSSAQTSGALLLDTRIVGHFAECKRDTAADQWVWRLRELLDESGISPAELTAIAVGAGPGSYAGIRSSMAAAQGLALPDHRPVLGYGSAFITAAKLSRKHPGRPIVIIGDARRGRFWVARFGTDPVPANHAGNFLVCLPNELEQHIPSDALVVTPEWDRIGEILKKRLPEHDLPPENSFPEAITLAELAATHPELAQPEPRPIYIHPPTR